MNRRSALQWLVVATAGLTGCLGSPLEELNNDDAPADDPSNDGVGRPIVAYEDLSTRGQEFVDAALSGSGHELVWFTRHGERTYIRKEGDAAKWAPVDDPLTLDSIDEELEAVFRAHDAYLEKNGSYYENERTMGHGAYRVRLASANTDDCDEIYDRDELSATQKKLADVLSEHGDVWVADRQYELIADADVYFDETGDRGNFFADVVFADQACLRVDDRRFRITHVEQDMMHSEGYSLESVDVETE